MLYKQSYRHFYHFRIVCDAFCHPLLNEYGILWMDGWMDADKTKEIVFHRPTSRHLNIPPPLPDIERVTQATLLGIDTTSSSPLSQLPHM